MFKFPKVQKQIVLFLLGSKALFRYLIFLLHFLTAYILIFPNNIGGKLRGRKCVSFITVSLRSNIFFILFSSVQSLSHVRLFATPWTAAHQASLSITNSRSLLKLMSTESVMPSNHFILCHPHLLPPSSLSQHQGLFQ